MMRSMYSGVAGLRAHQLRMDVIGNNIANVNTVGFKASKVSFSEIYSQTIKGAGAPSGGRGGTNPQQVGLGVNVGSITVSHTKGSTQRTDNATDIMIDGNGFFIVSNDVNNQNRFYTRAGNFIVDQAGYLVTPNGFRVLDNEFKPVQINQSETKAATASNKVYLNGNINFTAGDYSATTDVYDSLGNVHSVKYNFTGDVIEDNVDLGSGAADYSFKKLNVQFDNANPPMFGTDPTAAASANDVYAAFDTSGNFVGMFKPENDTKAQTVPVDFSNATAVGDTATVTVSGITGAADMTLNMNNSMFYLNGDISAGKKSLTQYAKDSDAKVVRENGNAAGSISSFSISSKGEVIGVFTNGERKVLQQIGLGSFDNPSGLLKIGNNMFSETPNSGTVKYGNPSSGSFGDLTPGALEMSNVDLAAEFTDMITTQRGYQANSRVISTSDEILQELVNLKR